MQHDVDDMAQDEVRQIVRHSFRGVFSKWMDEANALKMVDVFLVIHQELKVGMGWTSCCPSLKLYSAQSLT